MFTIDSEARVTPYSGSEAMAEDSGTPIHSEAELSALIGSKPGEWSVKLWNQLPNVTPIHTPPGEPSAKFRNKKTATERIWKKLCEIYPAAVLHPAITEDVSNAKDVSRSQDVKGAAERAARKTGRNRATKSAAAANTTNGTGRKSAWAEELTEELRKRYDAGAEFELADVYRLIPAFQRRHKDNHHVAARLRTTLAQDLRGNGIVKSIGKGKYRMCKP